MHIRYNTITIITMFMIIITYNANDTYIQQQT